MKEWNIKRLLQLVKKNTKKKKEIGGGDSQLLEERKAKSRHCFLDRI